jgi:rhodanese-related sulfurtransferase
MKGNEKMLKTPQQIAEEIRKEIVEVQAAQVRTDLDKGGALPYLLLDVREPHEQAQGIIPGAVPIARGVLEMQITKVTQDPNQPVICYCAGGTRSLFAAQQLKRMGFTDVKSLAGGFGNWAKSGNPVARPS